MNKTTITKTALALAGALVLTLPATARAHCDTMDGPVVQAAQAALENGKLEPVLIWVSAEHEKEIRHVFEHARSVRKLSKSAAQLADRFFLETLVRVHREGEGAPYTGLKPAGTDLGHVIPAADRAIATGDAAALQKMLNGAVEKNLKAKFADVMKKKTFAPDDVEAGRRYVAAYVELMHFVEGLEHVLHAEGGHGAAPAKASAHAH